MYNFPITKIDGLGTSEAVYLESIYVADGATHPWQRAVMLDFYMVKPSSLFIIGPNHSHFIGPGDLSLFNQDCVFTGKLRDLILSKTVFSALKYESFVSALKEERVLLSSVHAAQ